MKAYRYIMLLIVLLPLTVTGQALNDIVFKTKPLTIAIAQSPNLEIEKIINEKFSIGAEFTWRRLDWASSGGEYDFGRFYNSQGFRFGIISRFYFSSKNPAPNAWYAAMLFRYNSTFIKNLEKRSFNGVRTWTVDLYRKGPEFGFLIGRQLQFKKWTSEINIGLGNYWQDYEERLVAGNPSNSFVNGILKEAYSTPRPYIGWTIGYYLTTQKEIE